MQRYPHGGTGSRGGGRIHSELARVCRLFRKVQIFEFARCNSQCRVLTTTQRAVPDQGLIAAVAFRLSSRNATDKTHRHTAAAAWLAAQPDLVRGGIFVTRPSIRRIDLDNGNILFSRCTSCFLAAACGARMARSVVRPATEVVDAQYEHIRHLDHRVVPRAVREVRGDRLQDSQKLLLAVPLENLRCVFMMAKPVSRCAEVPTPALSSSFMIASISSPMCV